MDGSRDYDLCIRQQPKQARMCGVGGMSLAMFFFVFCFLFLWPWNGVRSLSLAADRRPIDPPPIVQLRVIDKARKNLPSPSPSPPPAHQQPPSSHPHVQQQQNESSGPLDTSMLTPAGFGTGPFLQNPYYFMFASLAKPDDDTELHWMKVRRLHFACTPACMPIHLLFTHHIHHPHLSGWQDQMYHGISRLVTLSPEGFRERKQRRWLLRLSGSQRAPRGVLSSQAQPFRSGGVRSHISFRLLPLFTSPPPLLHCLYEPTLHCLISH